MFTVFQMHFSLSCQNIRLVYSPSLEAEHASALPYNHTEKSMKYLLATNFCSTEDLLDK